MPLEARNERSRGQCRSNTEADAEAAETTGVAQGVRYAGSDANDRGSTGWRSGRWSFYLAALAARACLGSGSGLVRLEVSIKS